MAQTMKINEQALEALLTLAGQNAYNFDALVDLLTRKGIISPTEFDEAMETQYLNKHPDVTPAEWARRSISPEDGDALDAFFGVV